MTSGYRYEAWKVVNGKLIHRIAQSSKLHSVVRLASELDDGYIVIDTVTKEVVMPGKNLST